jgi:hypothetical protein
MIIGCDFLSDSMALLPAAHEAQNFNSIKIQNGIYDSMLVSKNVSDFMKYHIDTWNQYTVINANFDGDLTGGNLGYLASIVQSLRLKRREVGSQDWITLYEKEVHSAEDLDWVYIDKYARGRETEYEYAFCPLIQDSEQNLVTTITKSDFEGAVIADENTTYHILFDTDVKSTTRNSPAEVISTMSGKYPYVVYGSEANYETGTFTGSILKYDIDTDICDVIGASKYRNNFVTWLTNHNPKILKMYDGRIWIVDVTGNPQTEFSDHYDLVSVSFDFTEIGNSESSTDLYNNGFIGCNVEGS